MARLQELHPDQLAALRLIIGRRMSYATLATGLGLTPEQVRERALDAVDGLAPDDIEGLELDDRDRIADYLLGQQDDAERAATERLIGTSNAAREWLGRLTPELTPLAAEGLPLPAPTVPPGADVPATTPDSGLQPASVAADAVPPAPTASAGITAAFAAIAPPTSAGSSGRERLRAALGRRTVRIGGAATGIVVLLVVALLATGALGGSDDPPAAADAPSPAATTADDGEAALATAVVSALPDQVTFATPSSATGAARQAKAIGLPNINDNVPGLVFAANDLPKLPKDRLYAIWVDGGDQTPALLGRLDKIAADDTPLVDEKGTVERIFVPFATLDPTTGKTKVIDVRPYERIRVTRESPKATRPGATVLSASLK